MKRLKELLKLVSPAVVVASLCCLSPVILVLLGLSSVTFAASLADTFYGDYKWAFRAVGLVLLMLSLFFYFRKKGICTLDQVKRKRREIINTVLLVLVIGVLGYVFFLYVVVHYIGVWMSLW